MTVLLSFLRCFKDVLSVFSEIAVGHYGQDLRQLLQSGAAATGGVIADEASCEFTRWNT